MTSVGYGDIVATTHMGRGFAIAAIINGAFLLALLVGLISSWFKLDDTKQTTIKNIEMQNLAILSVRASLEYNIAFQKRKRYLRKEQKDYEIG
jgi:hypothetical protein